MLHSIGTRPKAQELVDLLIACHARIRLFTEQAIAVGERHEASEAEVAEASSGVHRYFSEALPLHVDDEEKSILPRLRGRSSEVDAALDRMHREHESHVAPLRHLLELTALLSTNPRDAAARSSLVTVARQLRTEFGVHLDSEESIVFPAIQTLLTKEERQAILSELRTRRGGEPITPSIRTPANTKEQRPMGNAHLHLQADQLYPFDARGIAKRFRHAAIFGALDALRPGETMRFSNDHDPLPLLDQLRTRYGTAVDIVYVSREPREVVIDFIKKG